MINGWSELKNEPCYWWLECLNYLFFPAKVIVRSTKSAQVTFPIIVVVVFTLYILSFHWNDNKNDDWVQRFFTFLFSSVSSIELFFFSVFCLFYRAQSNQTFELSPFWWICISYILAVYYFFCAFQTKYINPYFVSWHIVNTHRNRLSAHMRART